MKKPATVSNADNDEVFPLETIQQTIRFKLNEMKLKASNDNSSIDLTKEFFIALEMIQEKFFKLMKKHLKSCTIRYSLSM
jgi:hypothetical protein